MPRASVELMKGASARLLLFVVSVLVGFFMMPYLVHSLGEKIYGLWVMAGSIVAFYSLLDVGMTGSLQRFMMQSIYKKDKNDINTTLSTSIFITSIVGIIALLSTLLIILLGNLFVDEESVHAFKTIIALLGIKTALQFPLFSYYGILMAKYKYHVISNIQLITLLIRTSLIILLVEANYGVVEIALVTLITELFASICVTWFAYKYEPGVKISISYLRKKKFKQYLNYGKYAYLIAIANKVRISMDEVLAGMLISLVAVTEYTIGATLIRYFENIMGSIFGVFGSVLNKYHASGQIDKLQQVFLVMVEVSTLFAFLIGGGLFIFGEDFILSWMGEEYADSYIILQILLFSTIIFTAQSPNMGILMAIAKHKQQAYVTVVEAFLNILLSVTLISMYGIYGLALGTTIPLLINSLVIRPIYTCKQIKVKYSTYYYILLKIVLLTVIVGVVTSIIKQHIEVTGFMGIVIGGFIFSLLYFIFYVKYLITEDVSQYIEENIDGTTLKIFRLVKN